MQKLENNCYFHYIYIFFVYLCTMKISVLVPVYGVAKHIERCAISLFEQSYEDIEYIFVNDCTPDNSIKILETVLQSYPNRRAQTTIIQHKQNKGLGAARKTALNASTGDFIMHVDSDDYIDTEAISHLVECQEATQADIVTCAFNYFYEDGKETTVHYKCYSKIKTLKLLLIQNTLLPHIWARLIRRSVYTANGIMPIEGINMAEDLAITPRLIHSAHTIAYIDIPLYYYRINSSASTFSNRLVPKHIESYLKACNVLYVYFKEKDKKNDFRIAFEIGMLNAYWIAMKGNYDTIHIRQHCSYQPQGLIFKIILTIFAHKFMLSMLRLSYLSIKWLFKTYIKLSNL